jgi:hypothetical protein
MSAPVIIDGQVRQGTAKPAEMLKRVGVDLYREAYQNGMSFSAFLEMQDPSSNYRDGLDAFGRLCREARVRMRSHAGMGLYASEFGELEKHPQARLLIPEWISRIYREVQTGQSANTRALYTSGDDIPGSSLRPYAEAAALRTNPEIKPPIMLSDLVAITTPITGNTYRSVYMDTTAAQLRQSRVAESADIPVLKLIVATNTINLLKYGHGIQVTYEALRRTRLDKVAFWLRMAAIQAEMDKVSYAINIAVSGDGNSGTAATNWRAKTDLDAAATGKSVTLKAWLAFKLKFFPLYAPTHVIGVEGDILKVGLVNLGDSNNPVYMFNTTQQPGYQNTFRDGVKYGITADVPTDKLVALDANRALERVVEIGANIQEIERYAKNQTQTVYQTEVEAIAVLQPGATKTLELET